ncbi:MAG: DegV family protein [Bacilli bacterium]|nr:DegV family protein [Bacilli bacterium]
MKYKIVVDSSSNLKSDYIKDDEIGFEVVPLTVKIGEREFVDSDDANVEEMLEALKANKAGGTSSCPAPGTYAEAYKEADNIIVITISAKMSGSFNSAFVGSLEYKDKSIHIVDSKGTAGMMQLIVDKTYELIKSGMDFKNVEAEIDKYTDSLNLLFVLDKFDNLVRAGRMSKIAAFVATSLSIKPLCIANKGEIKILKKTRTMKMALKNVVNEMKELIHDDDVNRVCIITSVQNDPTALKLKNIIAENMNFKEIRIVDAKILDAYYELPGGLIVSF